MAEVSVALRTPCWYPSEGHQHGVSMQSSITLDETVYRITRQWKTAQTQNTATFFVYQLSILYLILD